MFTSGYALAAKIALILLIWPGVFVLMVLINGVVRQLGRVRVIILITLTASLLTLRVFAAEDAYADWMRMARVLASVVGCLGFWHVRSIGSAGKDGGAWRLIDSKLLLCLPPLFLAVNIVEACIRGIGAGGI